MTSEAESSSSLEKAARRFLEKDEPLSALPITEVLSSLHPDSDTYTLLYVEALFRVREYELALRVVSRLLSSSSSAPFPNENEGFPPNAGGTRLEREKNYEAALCLSMRLSFELANTRECARLAEQLASRSAADSQQRVLALCYMARCSELAGDPVKAASFYRKALKIDPYCGEALNALINRHLMTVNELKDVIDELALECDAAPLRAFYLTKIGVGPTQREGSTASFTAASENPNPQPLGSSDPAARAGVPMANSILLQAANELDNNNMVAAAQLTSDAVALAPFSRIAVCMRLSVLVDMKATPRLFEQAHTLSNSKTHSELAAYAIGCFYYSLSNLERAGRYFCRATELDPSFAEAWIAYGHCYAKLEEGEQALSVYRRALNMFPGLYQCNVFVGMQYSRIHQWALAHNFLESARKQAPEDALVFNEIGVVLVKTHRLEEAQHYFELALRAMKNPDNPSEHVDCILFNLATVCRKLRDFNSAVTYYTAYVKCRPNASHGHCALAFTHHLMGNLNVAISHYHAALSLKSDVFCRDMLDRALSSAFSKNVGSAGWNDACSDREESAQNMTAHGSRDFTTPSPSDVSFTSVWHNLRSASRAGGSVGPSPRPSVGRSLMY